MFILYALFFLLGIFLFGLAFTIPAWGGLIFVGGILSISLALALPFHFGSRT
ncbi:hypothetical protein [Microbacterium sp. bgisy189]|uniref:hypothetical protein n=1 Tax=Microbacterium sp. bgisy189 TaxID=3413798 RepID=UPI003EC128C8